MISIAAAFPFPVIRVLDTHLEDDVLHSWNLIARSRTLGQSIKDRLDVGFDLGVFPGKLAKINSGVNATSIGGDASGSFCIDIVPQCGERVRDPFLSLALALAETVRSEF